MNEVILGLLLVRAGFLDDPEEILELQRRLPIREGKLPLLLVLEGHVAEVDLLANLLLIFLLFLLLLSEHHPRALTV